MGLTRNRIAYRVSAGIVVAFVVIIMGSTVQAQFRSTLADPVPDAVRQELLRDAGASAMTQRIEAVLQHRQNWDFGEIKIADVVDVLRKQFQLPVLLDAPALQDEGVDPTSPISDVRGVMTLDRFLGLTLRPLQLTHFIEDEVLIITTQAKADECLTLKVYPVLDLVRSDDADDYVSLMTVIQQATSGQWEQFQGFGGTMTPLPATGSLFIRQTWQVHREIEGLLFTARKVRRLQQLPSFAADGDSSQSISVKLTGNELSATARQAPFVPSAPHIKSAAAAWQIPRVDRPGKSRKLK